MNARHLALPTILFVAFTTAGCIQSTDPEQAPPPRPQGERNKADLIVGKWKLVKRTPPNPGGPQMTFEYTKDGQVTLWIDEQIRESRIESGTYRVEGDVLYRSMIGLAGKQERNSTIESITEDKLVTSGSRTGERQIHEWERVRNR